MASDPRLEFGSEENVNDLLLDRIIRHIVFLEQYKNGQVGRFVGKYNDELFPEILMRVRADLERIRTRGRTISPKNRQRLSLMLGRIDNIFESNGEKISNQFINSLTELSASEAAWQRRVLRQVTPGVFQINYRLPSQQVLKSVVTSRFMQGDLVKNWFRRLDVSTRRSIKLAIQRGVVEGSTTDQIIRNLRGSRSNSYNDGVFQISRRNAEALIRTSIGHVSTHAREEVYSSNSDVIGSVRWVSVLDTRTSDICMARDGNMYPVGEGPRPPAHMRCRSVVVPVIKSVEEMGVGRGILDKLPPSTRASMNGQVPRDLTYGEWLKKQSNEIQNRALGPTRARMFRTGQLNIKDFVDSSGRSLTLKELRRLSG